MDTDVAPVVIIAHDNGLIGDGLVLLLEERLGVTCRAMSVREPDQVRKAVGEGTKVLVLECADAAATRRLRRRLGALPVVDITGVVRGDREPGAVGTFEHLLASLRRLIAATPLLV